MNIIEDDGLTVNTREGKIVGLSKGQMPDGILTESQEYVQQIIGGDRSCVLSLKKLNELRKIMFE